MATPETLAPEAPPMEPPAAEEYREAFEHAVMTLRHARDDEYAAMVREFIDDILDEFLDLRDAS